MTERKLRVLVVDDSAYNRQMISEAFAGHPEFEVVGKADDGEQGLKMVATLKPDLITLDVEMPRMDGFTFLRLLMSQMPTPVIVISSHNKKHEIFQALELGALEFIAKPQRYLPPELAGLREELLQKARAVRDLRMVSLQERAMQPPGPKDPHDAGSDAKTVVTPSGAKRVERLVVIGASTGGPPALQTLLKLQAAETPTAYLIAQHMPEKFTKAFAERLNRSSPLTVVEGAQGQEILPDHVYIAPGGQHMEIVEGSLGFQLRLVPTSTEEHYTPSVDRLLSSAAKVRTAKLLAVVLTGMGSDGARGVRDVKGAKGRVIVESQESAIVFGMPKEAMLTGCVDEVLPLDAIVERVVRFAQGS